MDFFLKFFLTFIMLFILWIILVFSQVANPTKMSQWVYDAYEKKTLIAHNTKGRKILIVAGSNALFGINSKMLQETFKIPVVNFGVNAGVLLPYTLYKAKEVINDEDIILMPLEYSLYTYNAMPNQQMIDSIFSRDIEVFSYLTLKEQFYMIWHVTFKRLYNGYKALGGERVSKGLYGAHHIDAFGDQIQTSLKDRTKGMQDELNTLKANKYGAEFTPKTLAWSYLENFIDWCDAKNVKVIFMPSTLMYFDTYKSDSKEKWFYENLANTIHSKGYQYVGNPYSYMYDKSKYLNTDFHLIDSARDIRTKQMILDLKSSKAFHDALQLEK